jgi:hypothetical protein
MSVCSECLAAQETGGLWQRYDPACLWCGARYVQAIGRQAISAAECKLRRLKVLKDWTAQGHDRETLRTLAKASARALQPRTGRAA